MGRLSQSCEFQRRLLPIEPKVDRHENLEIVTGRRPKNLYLTIRVAIGLMSWNRSDSG